MWKEFDASRLAGSCPAFSEQQGFDQMVVGASVSGHGHGLGLDFGSGRQMSMSMPMMGGCGDRNVDMQNYATAVGLDSLFEPATFDSGFGYEFNEMLHE